ncbi:MAG TPA: prepilin-type N-terminal cleavage/methylation domain-containing protein [Pyrinomonadaceae bacterium]|jgi:prepilin-type N-terminal cleavage/methylation domain-containing protein
MKTNTQSGFSLIELLLVVTIIGVIATIGIPQFQKGIRAADNGAAFATLRTMSSVQVNYYSQHGRFANMSELNEVHNNTFGELMPDNSLKRGRFVYEMSPSAPDPETDLKTGYTVIATSPTGATGDPYVFRLNQSGEIVQVTP